MADAIRIGILNDMADLGGDTEVTSGPGDIGFCIERASAALAATGRITSPVEIVHAYALGLPSGTSEAVERAFHQLADAQVSLIVGPFVGDNAMIVAPLAKERRIPTIICSDEERARARHAFQLQSGSPEEEAALIVEHLHARGAERIALFHDGSRLGERLARFVRLAAANWPCVISSQTSLEGSPANPTPEDTISQSVESDADAIVYLGRGHPPAALAQAARSCGFEGPALLNRAAAMLPTRELTSVFDGWLYPSLVSDRNPRLRALLSRIDDGHEYVEDLARGDDLGRLVAEGLARAPTPGPSGMRLGLEQVKWLPAAQGEPGTLLGFGTHDRAALHGRYLVVRQWREGRSVEVELPPPDATRAA